MNLKSEAWQALLPKSLLDKIAKTGKVNQEPIIELFITCLSGGYTYKEVEDLMYAQTELYRLCDIADLLQELEETKIRFQQRVR
jgi:hypothetical protein